MVFGDVEAATESDPDRPHPYLYDVDAPCSCSDMSHGHNWVSKRIQNAPKPIPLIAPLFGFTERRRVVRAAHHYIGIAALAQRDITEAEGEAIMYHSCKAYSISSYGGPVGIAAGCYRAYASRGEYRFPFWKPNAATFNPHRPDFRLFNFRGQNAVRLLHAARFSTYATVGWAVGRLVFSSYGGTVGAIGHKNDKRLKKMNDELLERTRRGENVQKTAAEYIKKQMVATMSPDERATFEAQVGALEAGQDSRTTPKSPTEQERPATRNVHRDPVSDRNTEDADSFFDDASPTAGSEQREAASSSGSSAWDRIRSGKGPPSRGFGSLPSRGSNQSSTSETESKGSAWSRTRSNSDRSTEDRPPQDRQDGSNSFSFSTKDEERQLAKSEAQKEFDARIERERRGEDFDKDEGSSDRWK